MVFENIVANVLNRFLGDFVDNLDPSQLNIGIWGGNVELCNLEIKETALDFFDLPIKLKFGYLSSLVMQIPWKNLYTEPVLINIEGLHIIVVPNQGVNYNEEKAKKYENEIKQKALKALEENRRNKRNKNDQENDTFIEKLIAQIIKNLEVNIKSIHVRYEDKFSNRESSFSVGLTLESLEFQTTDSNYIAKIHKEEIKIFYKLISLNNLAIYWNSNSNLISDSDLKSDILLALQSTIATKYNQPDSFEYVFGPISINAKLELNKKPEAEKFLIPKINLAVETNELLLCLNKYQYHDILYFLEAQERFNLASSHLKFRPNLTSYRGYYKQWYLFAYNCILADIYRRKKNWSWEHMKNHKKLVKEYSEAWLHFRTEKEISATYKSTIDKAEEELDVFNLNIARQQAEMNIDRLKLIRTEDQKVETWGNWAKSWFGGKSKSSMCDKESKSNEIISQFQEAMTLDEKKKLFAAIDYQENIPSTNYPKEFIENVVSIKLSKVTIAVDSVIELCFSELSANIEQRPSACAIFVRNSIKSLTMNGLDYPMIKSLESNVDWLYAEFITNPLDGSFDQCISFTTAPVVFKYNAMAVNAFLDVFKPPKSIRLNQLATTAFARYEEVKARSVTGLQYAIEKSAKLKLKIHLSPTTIVVSKGGNFNESKPNIVAQLGSLDVNTIENLSDFNFGGNIEDNKNEVLLKAYLKIKILISDIQLSFADSYSKCIQAQSDPESRYHILKPMGMELDLCKALIDDLQVPRFRICGNLPKVSFAISDHQLTRLLELLLSIPFPSFNNYDEDENDENLKKNILPTAQLNDFSKISSIVDINDLTTKKERSLNCNLVEVDPQIFVFEFKVGEVSTLLFSRKFQKNLSNQTSFGDLYIKKLYIGGFIKESTSLKCKITLYSITLDDKRSGATIQRFLDKKKLNQVETSSDSLFELDFEQNSNSEKKVNLISSSIYLLLNPEFLSALFSFVVIPKLEEVEKEDDFILHPELAINVTHNKSFSLSVANNNNKKKKKISDAPVSSLTMNCKIQEVEVILIENSYKPDESQALILSFNTEFNAENENNIQHFNGSIKNLQIISTYYAIEKRFLSSYSVLNKLEIMLNGSIDVKNKTQDFSITMNDVHVKVSPAVIRLLSTVGNQCSTYQLPNDNINDSEKVLKSYPNYWSSQKIKKTQYWWFKSVSNESDEINFNRKKKFSKNFQLETAVFTINSFVITIEAGLNDITTPMILIKSSLAASAKNWSSLLEMNSSIFLQMSYYNEAFCVWEPVIEPVCYNENDKKLWKSWQLNALIITNDDDPITILDEDGKSKTIIPPKMNISIEAEEMMNVTITKSFLQLINQLKISFQEAALLISPQKSHEYPGTSEYLICNQTGINIKILNSNTLKISNSKNGIELPHFQFYELDILSDQFNQLASTNLNLFEEGNRKKNIKFECMGTEQETNIMRAEKVIVQLPKDADSFRKWEIVVDTRIENLRHIIFLCSVVNFVNHLTEDIEIYATDDSGTRISLCGIAKTNSQPLFIPIQLLYSPTGQFYFRLANDKYEQSNEAISWHKFETVDRWTVRCDLLENSRFGYYIEAVVETEDVINTKKKTHSSEIYTVHLYPPLFFHNLLPLPLEIKTPIQKTLDFGEGVPLNLIPGLILEFSIEYNETIYTSSMIIPQTRQDLETITLESIDKSGKIFNVGLNWSTKNKQLELSIFVRYWMINNTNKQLHYLENYSSQFLQFCPCSRKGYKISQENKSKVIHKPDQNPFLISLNSQNFFEKKKAKVSIVGLTNFSNEFPLDTAGSAGRVICLGTNNQEYELSIDVQLCKFGLTKVITISPFYLVQNECKFDIEFSEFGSENWIKVSKQSVIDLWPCQKSKRKTMCVRYLGQKENSVYFPFTETFESFCKIKNEYLGVYITCIIGESSSVIRIESFTPGMVPAILMNATDLQIKFCQVSSSDLTKKFDEEILEPWHLKAFSWSDVTETKRVLWWQCGDFTGIDKLVRNGMSSYLPGDTKGYYYWISFFNGRQRILLFTHDIVVANIASQSYEVERIVRQTELSIFGIGISLVNNLESVEVLYISMSSSGILWEQLNRNRYRTLSVKAMEECEEAYKKWLSIGSPDSYQITENYEIDFINWNIKNKGNKHSFFIKIRRCFQNGVWIQYRQSAHQHQLHFKLNNLSVNNQLSACIFPCVLAVVPPPKSVVGDNAPRPFTELSFIMSKSEYSNVVEIKYLHILVQEFAISIDNGLINAILSLFSTESIMHKLDFKKDLELTKSQLSRCVLHTTETTQHKSYYDDLHISPLMVHLSFSQGGSHKKNNSNNNGGINIHSEFLNVILKSVGVTLTELQNIVFKLAYFERKHAFYSAEELQAEIQSHYTFQLIKQLYVLVLGLDIIGNPFGLVRDLSSGVEDFFYQPFQGAIQGPEEFAEGLALGVQSLFGHAVGGAAGAVSRITSTLGKGVAALTLDNEYQRKRQENLNRKPQNLSEGLTRGAKGVGQGVYDGFTGIFLKPIQGARSGGFSGFARGVGKGVVGVVARPVSGVVDFASGTLDALKNIATNNDNFKSDRLPRVIHKDHIIRPFSYEDAVGYKIFRDTDHGKYVDTDNFICHGFVSSKFVFIVTDLHIILSKHQDIIGNWTTEWVMFYTEIKEPKIVKNGLGILLELKQKRKGFLNIGSTNGRCIIFNNVEIVNQIFTHLISAYELQQ